MKDNWSLPLFRAVLILSFLLGMAYLGYLGTTIWYYYLGCILGFLSLWLFGNFCEDVHQIRENLGKLDSETNLVPIWNPPQPHEDPLLKLIDSARQKQLGDRIFKTDVERVCQNCGMFLSVERKCQLDGSSLLGITIHAVGCQHWTDKIPSNPKNNP